MRIISEEKLVITPQMMANRTQRALSDRPRSSGVHIQAINKKLGIAAGKLSDSDDSTFPFELLTSENYPIMLALGVAWEEMAASFYREDQLIWQPYELCRDDIYGTPDGLIIDQDEPMAWECKQTTKKVQSIEKCWMYIKQSLSYFAMGGPAITVFDVCWLLGDYTRPYQPIGTRTIVEYSREEAEAWWRIVVRTSAGVDAEYNTEGNL